MDFYQIDGRYRSPSTSAYHLSFSVPRPLANKKSDSQSITVSDKILPSSNSESRFYSKPKKVQINTCSEFHIHRHGISDTAEFSQGSSGTSPNPNIDYQNSYLMQSAQTFLSLLGKLSAAADLTLLGRLHFDPCKLAYCLSGDLTFCPSIIRS